MPEDIKHRNPWDEIGFDEFSVYIDPSVTKKRSIIENYLFSEKSCRVRKVTEDEALRALEYMFNFAINLYNKLRDSYKELYLELRDIDKSKRMEALKLTEKRKYLEEYSYNEEMDFIALNLAQEFDETENAGIAQPRTSQFKRKRVKSKSRTHEVVPSEHSADVVLRKTVFDEEAESTTAEGENLHRQDSGAKSVYTTYEDDKT